VEEAHKSVRIGEEFSDRSFISWSEWVIAYAYLHKGDLAQRLFRNEGLSDRRHRDSKRLSKPNLEIAMWTPATRREHSREGLRYETDLSDKEWLVIEPHLPPPEPLGRPRDWTWREIVNAIFYVLRGGIAWRLLPNDFPPWQTVYRWFAAWRDGGLFEKINHALVMADRQRVGREASPSAAIIDSQSVKTTEAGGPRGYDAGKKINGRKRHALVDTDGRGLLIEPHPASIQDRDGGGPLLHVSRRPFPFIEKVFADSGYAAERVARATVIAVEIVRKNPNQVGFAVNPRRWVVERFFAWIGRNRRLAKDFEATIDSARAFLYAASVMLLVRRIGRAS
jgi:putative transposase